MIKIYTMKSCPDCVAVDKQVECNSNYQIIDIGENVLHLKEFLRLRDNNPIFKHAKQIGSVGIPCFVLDNGTVTLNAEEAGLHKMQNEGAACNIDGTGC